ncbi:MAG: rhodanese-like domain-containing protein [Pseudomonadota bacterium]
MQQISAQQLAAWLAEETDSDQAKPRLLDVREDWEYALCHLDGAQAIPMGSVPSRLQELVPTEPIVVICHHGMRSMQVALFLEQQGFNSVFNLTGGVHAWAQEIDSSMAQY